MAEYPARSCGPCPYTAQFASNPPQASDFLAQNTVPQPQIQSKDPNCRLEYKLGVTQNLLPPDLNAPPTKLNYDLQKPTYANRNEAVARHNAGGMPPCLEANLNKCCLENNHNENKQNKVVIDCELFNKEGTVKPLKGILKNSEGANCSCPTSSAVPALNKNISYPSTPVEQIEETTRPAQPQKLIEEATNRVSYQPQLQKPIEETTNRASYQPQAVEMHATAGRQDPQAQETPQTESRLPINATEKPACYLPQHEDTIMAKQIEMGPVGPWATGKADWGPLGVLTGTRPVVDKYSITRYSTGEWRSHNKQVLEKTQTEQHRANLVDWNGRQCLEQTQSDVDKNQEDNTKRLDQREREILRWKCELERAIAAASEEMSLMEEQRKRLKQAAAVLQMPESIAGECLERRTGRLDSELVRDEVEDELIREVALCSEIRDIFSRTLKDVEMQLLEDKTAKQRLEYDWSDKRDAHEIDALNCSLNTRSTTLLFKPGSVLFPDNQSTPEYWEHFTKETLLAGEATRQRSVTLRGTLDAILINAARDLRTQADRVELALSKKIACTEEVVRRFENELKQILRQLADVEDLINTIRAAIRRMDIPMKKAQTRLDNRLARARVENCRDAPHFGLIDEVKSIAENVAALQGQLGQAQKSQDDMITVRSTLEREIMLKKKTLEIDRDRIKRIRSHYPSSTALTGY
ncbi:unnamed protein product [Ceutorhynchus assimilis]|uniref:Tektin n=1 Tax=Ceutorhynchus assimilis TaxID=467358 RepID=A0A9N9ME65_9CUCU|nr:unnamed protein product [Ceutorhynchus assimilis]